MRRLHILLKLLAVAVALSQVAAARELPREGGTGVISRSAPRSDCDTARAPGRPRR